MAETFGLTTKGEVKFAGSANQQWAAKFTSGSAGDLVSITLYVEGAYDNTLVKCAIYDSDLNLLTNGITAEQTIHSTTDDWVVFNFSSYPSVTATTIYHLAWWCDNAFWVYRNDGTPDQTIYDAKAYNSWDDPLVISSSYAYEPSIYATYEEAPPPAAKAIVQAALISIPPLIVLPTLSQILKVTGGC